MEAKKWGVIYNPKAGTRKVQKRWKAIKAYMERLASGEESEGREFWFGFRQSGVDGLSFIKSRTEREYASHVYRAVWRWSFTVEEREYGPYIGSKLEKLLVI